MKSYMIIISYYNIKENQLATEVFDEVYDDYSEASWRAMQLAAEKSKFFNGKGYRPDNDSYRTDLPSGKSYLYSIKEININISI